MTIRVRTIWLSDVHLGSRGCQIDKLLYFLREYESEYLILVGDIIDFWALKRSMYWPQTHSTAIQKVLKKARHGTKVIFIPGNHDESLRDYIGLTFGEITIHEDYVHTLANNKLIFCLHGDLFDVVTRYHKWLAVAGDIGYNCLLWLNRIQNQFRSLFGAGYWSLSSFIKYKVKEAVNFISDYEENIIHEAKRRDVDGILCGHIHHPEIREVDGIVYLNTGDVVESCSAIIEEVDGTLKLINFSDKINTVKKYDWS